MNTFLTFILLQFGLIGSNAAPLEGAKVYLHKTSTNEVVAFTKIGSNGNFQFSNLDPGKYTLSLEILDNLVMSIDKKSKQKYETDILVGFNRSKKSLCWHRTDGYVELKIGKGSKVAEDFVTCFAPNKEKFFESGDSLAEHESFFDRIIKGSTPTELKGQIDVVHFTIIGKGGSFSGSINSIGQKDFFKNMVGNGDMSLEEEGKVQIILKDD
jgi:hypothetical protein